MVELTLTLFIVMNSLGNIAPFLAILRHFEPKEQSRIIFRECSIALLFILFFNFLGDFFFTWLKISSATIQISGGIILFFIAMDMIFPNTDTSSLDADNEPFIVPLAVPMFAGPGTLTTVLLEATREPSTFRMLGAILCAWMLSTTLLLAAPKLNRILGQRGIIAIERLMGMVLLLIAVSLFLDGSLLFMHHRFAR